VIAEPSERSEPAVVPTGCFELEEDFNEEEFYIKLHCLSMSCRHPCVIKKSWLGILDLAAVAVATNVALEILQRAEFELLQVLPKKFNLNSFEKITGLLILVGATSKGIDPNTRHQATDVIGIDLKDVADFTTMPIYTLLNSCLQVVQEGHLLILKPGYFGELDTSGREMSWREQLN